MKSASRQRRVYWTAALFLLVPLHLLRADVFYSGLRNIAVPTDFAGVYLNVDTGAITSASGWDINVTFGGGRVYNSDRFQPARLGTGHEDPIIALSAGAIVDGSLIYATGFGASGSHLGPAGNQFQPGQEEYIGFSFKTDANSGPHYGWMRVVFTSNEPGGLIKDWGYETGVTGTAPKSITTGNILQAAPSGGVSVVTLTAASGQASTLGSILSDMGSAIVTALRKTDIGTWTLSGDQIYTGATTVQENGGTLEVGSANGKLSGTTSINIHEGGTFLLSGAGGTNVKLNNAAPVILAGGRIDLGGMSSSLNQTVGTLTLSASASATESAARDSGTLLDGYRWRSADDVASVTRDGRRADLLYASPTFNQTVGASNDVSATSILDFGTLLAGNTWKFAASNADWSGVQLSIFNYTPGTDHLIFGSSATALNTTQLDHILFYSDNGSDFLGSARWSGGTGEVVPIPEPGTWAAGLLAVGALAYVQRRHRRSRTSK